MLSACYAPSAARHAEPVMREGWDLERHGGNVVWRGPASTKAGMGDFVVHAVVPPGGRTALGIAEREPQEKWFRAYGGPMRELDEVAILCHSERSTSVYSIRDLRDQTTYAARHQRWHYPRCIEVLPGVYRLEVNYYARGTVQVDRDLRTHTVESSRPSVTDWEAEAGSVYQLDAIIGAPQAAPGEVPGFFNAAPRKQSPGTTTYDLQVSTWNVRIARVPSAEYIDEPVLEFREQWRNYETSRR